MAKKLVTGSRSDPQGRPPANDQLADWAESTPGGYVAKKVMRATGMDKQRVNRKGKGDRENDSRPAVGGPPKHLAYITEDEARLLDIILTIKKGAKGKDGKSLPQTYKPGEGSPMEFLTELSPQQIDELLKATDNKAEMTPEGVPSYADDSASSMGVSRPSSSTSKTTTKSSGSSFGGGGRDAGANSPSGDRGAGVSRSPGGDFKGSVAPAARRDTPGAFGGSNAGGTMSGVRTPAAPAPKIAGGTISGVRSGVTTRVGTGDSKSALAKEAERRHGVHKLQDQYSLYRSPPGSPPSTISGEGKKVGFTKGADLPAASSIPSSSELAGLVASRPAPEPDPRFNVGVIDTPRLMSDPTNGVGRSTIKPSPVPNTTTSINKKQGGPMPQIAPDASSELANLAVGSQFNTPLADDPGAYDNSELANAVTGETPRRLGGGFEDYRIGAGREEDSLQTFIANRDAAQIMADQTKPAPLGQKGDRVIPGQPPATTTGAGKTAKVRSIIMGAEPITQSGVVAKAPDSSLSPLVTEKMQDRLAPEEGQPNQINRLSPLGPNETVALKNSSLPTLQQMSERNFSALAPANDDLIAEPAPEEFIDPEMPDIGFDANNPDQTPAELGYEGTEALPAPTERSLADSGGDFTLAQEAGLEPAPAPAPEEPGDGSPPATEYLPGIMPWDRSAFAEIAAAYEAAGQTYTPAQFMAAFYNSKPFTIERPAADEDAAFSGDPSIDPWGGVMPWDRQIYTQLRKLAEARGETYTPEQFAAQFYVGDQRQAA